MNGYRARSALYSVIVVMLALLIAFVVGGILLYVGGFNPFQAYKLIFKGAFIGKSNILSTLYNATPLLLTGFAYAFAQHAGIINLGTEGQLYVGAFVAALLGGYLPVMPKIIFIPLIIIISCAAAGLAGMLISWLKIKFGANEIIVAIMLNNMITKFTSYLVNGPLLDSQGIARTPKIPAQAQIGRIFADHYLSWVTLIAVIAVLIGWFVLNRTNYGFEMHALRSGKAAAETAGVSVNRIMVITFFISGAIAGLCGVGQVLGVTYRFSDGFSSGYGFNGIAVAALAGNDPLMILLSAILWGGLKSGAAMVNRIATIPMDFISLIQALVVIMMAAPKCMDTLCMPLRKALLKEDYKHD